ncbi:MAG: hypothetical protein VYA30_02090 [Myxococcota bacterium]|nr:hypothetical protein [Myxococcota bacterium]
MGWARCARSRASNPKITKNHENAQTDSGATRNDGPGKQLDGVRANSYSKREAARGHRAKTKQGEALTRETSKRRASKKRLGVSRIERRSHFAMNDATMDPGATSPNPFSRNLPRNLKRQPCQSRFDLLIVDMPVSP